MQCMACLAQGFGAQPKALSLQKALASQVSQISKVLRGQECLARRVPSERAMGHMHSDAIQMNRTLRATLQVQNGLLSKPTLAHSLGTLAILSW